MKKGLYIVLFAFGLTGCATQMPMDDAYYRPEKTVVPSTPSVPSSTSTTSSPSQPGSTMQILHQSDTTITVRIKR